MRYALSNKNAELPYGSIITIIAKRRNVFMDVDAAALPSYKGTYNSRLQQNLGFKLSNKGWVRVEDPNSDEDPSARKGKRKIGTFSKKKMSPRKSPQWHKDELAPLWWKALSS